MTDPYDALRSDKVASLPSDPDAARLRLEAQANALAIEAGGKTDGEMVIRIGGYDLEVVFDPQLMRAGLMGEIDTLGLSIRILPDLEHPVFMRVLLHEVIHGILDNAGVVEHDEQIVDAIANGLVQVFRDNAFLVEWLVEKE